MTELDHFEEHGFATWSTVINHGTLNNLYFFKDVWDNPQRGHSCDDKYHHTYANDIQWGNYWTESLSDHTEVLSISSSIRHVINQLLDEPVFYHSDVSVLMPGSTTIRPHVDTPYRHEPWNHKINQRLGVQVAIPMQEFELTAGHTAFLPGSHRKYWNIRDCYNGVHTDEFKSGAVQPELAFSDVIIWDARTLHSQMPNPTNTPRYVLLLNYVEKRIYNQLNEFENAL